MMRTLYLLLLTLALSSFLACQPKTDQVAKSKRSTSSAQHSLDLGNFFLNHENYPAARAEFVRLILHFPTSQLRQEAQYKIAETYFGEGSYREAAAYYEEYLQNYPNGKRKADAALGISRCILKIEKIRLAQLPKVKLVPPEDPGTGLPPPAKRKTLHNVRTTWYWIEHEKDFKQEHLTELLDPQGKLIALIPEAFMRRLRIEGTGRLADGRLVNWARDGRFIVLDQSHPYGMGVRNLPLIPLRTIAVDPNKIPLGSTVYIRAFDGLNLPNGNRHDGCFVAHDVGSAIKGSHIDLFSHDGQLARSIMRQVPENVSLSVGRKRCHKKFTLADRLAGSK